MSQVILVFGVQLKESFYWPGYEMDIENLVHNASSVKSITYLNLLLV